MKKLSLNSLKAFKSYQSRTLKKKSSIHQYIFVFSMSPVLAISDLRCYQVIFFLSWFLCFTWNKHIFFCSWWKSITCLILFQTTTHIDFFLTDCSEEEMLTLQSVCKRKKPTVNIREKEQINSSFKTKTPDLSLSRGADGSRDNANNW